MGFCHWCSDALTEYLPCANEQCPGVKARAILAAIAMRAEYTEENRRRLAEKCTLDPRNYDNAYFVVPDKAGFKAFALLLRVMERVPVAWLTMRQREHLCTIRPFQEGQLRHPLFLLQTLFYADELRDAQPLTPSCRRSTTRNKPYDKC